MGKNKNIENEIVEEEKVEVRHTITAEETFTLAKDIFDMRTFIKNIYANRAVISRRLNILTMILSMVYTLVYVGYIFITAFYKKLSPTAEWVLYGILIAYGIVCIALIVATLCLGRASAKSIVKYKRTLKIVRLIFRLISLAVTIAVIAFTTMGGDYAAAHMATDVVFLVVSIIMMIMQIIPILCGGIGKLVRWLLSPVKIKYHFSAVVLEWYELAVSGKAKEGAAAKVSAKYFERIGILLDNYLIPELGRKYITAIKPAQILSVVSGCDVLDRPILEGVLKNVFVYATECGYVTFDVCKDLQFEGSVEVEEVKPKPTMKEKLFGVGKKIGKDMLDKYVLIPADEQNKRNEK